MKFFIQGCELRAWGSSYWRCYAGWDWNTSRLNVTLRDIGYGGNGGTIWLQVPYLQRLMGLLILWLGLMLLPPVFCSPNKQRYKNLSRFFWGTYSINSESVVATVHELRSPSLGKCKSVRFSDDSGPDKAPSKAKGLPQHSQHQPLPHHRVIPNLVDEKQVQEKKILTKSTQKQIPPCFKSRTYVVPHPTTERRKQASLPAGSLPGKHGQIGRASCRG